MRRRQVIALIGGAAVWPLSAKAETPLIGFLSSRSARDSGRLVAAFERALGEVGFSQGRNLLVDYRFADGALDRLPDMARELAQRPLAVLVAAGGSNSALAAKRATSTIPIVFVIGGDPVRLGLAASIARPGGNATGITIISADLAPKRLGLLRELVPNAGTFAVLTNPNTPEGRGQASDMLTAALALGLKLRMLEASDERAIDAIFAALSQEKPDALLIASDPLFDVHRDKLVASVAAAAIPAIYQFRDYAIAGGLMSYDPDIVDAYRQVGVYAGRILKGAAPADLPIQQPIRYNLVINLRTAKALGLTISPSLLVRADEVIE